MFCEYCGKQLKDTARFCNGCGKPVQGVIIPDTDTGLDSSATDCVNPATLSPDASATDWVNPAALGSDAASTCCVNPALATEMAPKPISDPAASGMNQTSATQTIQLAQTNQTVQSAQSAQFAQPAQSAQPPLSPLSPWSAQQPPKKKKSRAALVIALILLVLLLGSAVVFFVLKSGGSSESWQESYDLGMQYLEEENYEEAIVAFTKAIEIEPTEPDSYVGRGDAYIQFSATEENLALAQSDYETALELDETIPEAYLGIADIYIRQGDYDSARTILEDALEKTDSDEDIANKLEEIDSGNIQDSSGHIRRRTGVDASGMLLWYHEYTYNPDGSTATATSYDSEGNQTGYVECVQGEEGRALVDFGWDGVWGYLIRFESEYDADGRLTRETEYDVYADGTEELVLYRINTYDADGRLLREDHYNAVGELLAYYLYEYDGDGYAAKRLLYSIVDTDGTEELWGYDLFETDSNGNTTRQTTYYADGTLQIDVVNLYNEDGVWIGSEEYDGDGNLTYSTYTE